MKLSILVPHYQEESKDIEPLLDSIAIQQNVDFDDIDVIISYDGKEAFELNEEEWASKYPFEIKHLKKLDSECQGVSATRNDALKASKSDYVIFCDADDMFCHACGLYILFQEMENGFDTLVSNFIEETRHPETKKPVYVNHEMDSTFVHGKVHRRKYLRDNNIQFNPKLTVHEDSYFNMLAQGLAKEGRAKYCPTPFYLWKWRDASVCRHDPDYILKTYNNMLDSNDSLVDEFERRKHHDKSRFYCCFMIFDAYYTLNKKEWIDKTNQSYRDSVEKRFHDYYVKHKDLWDEASDEEKMQISNGVRTRSVAEGMPMESITIGAWLDHILAIE